MDRLNTYSYFLMDKFLESFQMNEGVDYEWDLENNTETDHRNNTVTWLESSLKGSNNKKDWFKTILSKISKFKKSKRKVVLSITIPLLLTFMSNKDILNVVDHSGDKVPKEIVEEVKTYLLDEVEVVGVSKTFGKFLDSLKFKESSNNWKVVNKYGYMGLYQIGKEALKDISNKTNDKELKGIHNRVTASEFRENPNIFPPDLQEKAFIQLLKNNKHYLRRFTKYIGKTIGGIKVTESGMLAAAHLVGNGSVKQFLKSEGKIDKTDANGVPCSHYLKYFSGYNVDI